jgi:hypothetical protein
VGDVQVRQVFERRLGDHELLPVGVEGDERDEVSA